MLSHRLGIYTSWTGITQKAVTCYTECLRADEGCGFDYLLQVGTMCNIAAMHYKMHRYTDVVTALESVLKLKEMKAPSDKDSNSKEALFMRKLGCVRYRLVEYGPTYSFIYKGTWVNTCLSFQTLSYNFEPVISLQYPHYGSNIASSIHENIYDPDHAGGIRCNSSIRRTGRLQIFHCRDSFVSATFAGNAKYHKGNDTQLMLSKS